MFKFCLTLVALFQVTYGSGNKCRALVLGGGSDRGAYQAGVIAGLASYLPPGEANWNVVLGNGIGAFNAFFVAQTIVGEEATLNFTLSEFWLNFKRSQFYHSWFGGMFVGYFFKTGLFNDDPLVETIKTHFTGSFKRYFLLGVTDLYESKYYMLNSSQSNENLLLAVKASLNTHGNFPIVNFGDYQFASGEISVPVDASSAIWYCKKLGYNNADIIVDIAMVTNRKLNSFTPEGKNSLEMTLRYYQIVNYHNVFQRIISDQQNFPGVNFRTVIPMPFSIPMNSNFPFSYENKKTLATMYNAGIQAAKTALGK